MPAATPVADLCILRASPADAAAISALIQSLGHFITLGCDDEGAQQLLSAMTPKMIESYITNPAFVYFIGRIDADLVGAVAIRDARHLFHLFVATGYQRQGFARALWLAARKAATAAGNDGAFTVNSTLYAVPVYQHFGFVATGPRNRHNGIVHVPMTLQMNRQ